MTCVHFLISVRNRNTTDQHEQEATDLLLNMLCDDPETRVSAQFALEHPYLRDLAKVSYSSKLDAEVTME